MRLRWLRISPYACLPQCIGLPKPVKFTRAACKEAYKVVDSSWLDDNANLLSPKPLLYLEGDVLAVISTSPLYAGRP